MPKVLVPLSLSLLALASCQAGQFAVVSPFSESEPETMVAPADDPNGWGTGVQSTDDVLYGWDGSPVNGPIASQAPGTVQIVDRDLGHGLEGSEGTGGSRLVLLDLYNQAVGEREELALQVDIQNEALEQAERRYQDLERRYAELEEGFDTLSAQKSAVEEERRELAARLTTAQIRRLEAEKAWLVSAIEWRDMESLTARARPSSATEPVEGDQ